MNIEEILLFAKILAYLSGDKSINITSLDKEQACSALKRMANQNMNWSPQQREWYKAFVDFVEQSL